MSKFFTSFWVPGNPRPKGNLQALCPGGCPGNQNGRRGGRPFVTESFRGDAGKVLRAWLDTVRAYARNPPRPLQGAVSLTVEFFFERPASNKSAYPTTTRVADGDKLVRSIADALAAEGKQTGRMYGTDSQIMDWCIRERWADERGAGAQITVAAMELEQLPLTDDAPIQHRALRKPRAQPAKRRAPKQPKRFAL